MVTPDATSSKKFRFSFDVEEQRIKLRQSVKTRIAELMDKEMIRARRIDSY